MSIETIVRNIGHSSFVPPMHVLIACVNRGRVQSVPVELGGLSIKERRLIFN